MLKNKLLSQNNILLTIKTSFLKFYTLNTKSVSEFGKMQFKAKLEKKAQLKELEKIKLENKKEDELRKKEEEARLKLEKEKSPLTQRTKIFANPLDALSELKKILQRFPNQTINMVVALNVDLKRGDQVVRGLYKMPGGSNKIPKIMVFTSPPFYEIAKAAGADSIADTNTYKNITEGIIDFDKCVCTLDTLQNLKTLGRILGPKGLMPNVKVGTACTSDNLTKIIKELKLGTKEFKTDVWGQIQVPIGRRDYADKNLMMNIDSFMKVLYEKKPEVIKGRYFLYAYLFTYKHSYRIDMKALDPKSPTYFGNDLDFEKI